MSAALVLASKSVARQAVLEGAGVAFEAVGSGVDEDAAKIELAARRATPRQVAEALAEDKALTVSVARPELVLGADQTLEFQGQLFDKAETIEAARDRLKTLRGKPHQLHSAVVVAQGGAVVWRDTQSATLRMRDSSPTSSWKVTSPPKVTQRTWVCRLLSPGGAGRAAVLENRRGLFHHPRTADDGVAGPVAPPGRCRVMTRTAITGATAVAGVAGSADRPLAQPADPQRPRLDRSLRGTLTRSTSPSRRPPTGSAISPGRPARAGQSAA